MNNKNLDEDLIYCDSPIFQFIACYSNDEERYFDACTVSEAFELADGCSDGYLVSITCTSQDSEDYGIRYFKPYADGSSYYDLPMLRFLARYENGEERIISARNYRDAYNKAYTHDFVILLAWDDEVQDYV